VLTPNIFPQKCRVWAFVNKEGFIIKRYHVEYCIHRGTVCLRDKQYVCQITLCHIQEDSLIADKSCEIGTYLPTKVEIILQIIILHFLISGKHKLCSLTNCRFQTKLLHWTYCLQNLKNQIQEICVCYSLHLFLFMVY
jgi:hypothetical protein